MRDNLPRQAQAKKAGSRPATPRRGSLRQAERTQATRQKLLLAAKQIFANVGFEAARLEDISARAGYTRGAFYANFKSKEDIFFALLEEWVRERIESITAAVSQHSGPAEKFAALRKHYSEVARDRWLVLISLEFKLYALRHPEAHARLQNRHRKFRASFGKLLGELLHPLHQTLALEDPTAAAACLGNLAEGLLLEHLVDPKTLSDGDVRRVLGLFFDSMFQADVA